MKRFIIIIVIIGAVAGFFVSGLFRRFNSANISVDDTATPVLSGFTPTLTSEAGVAPTGTPTGSVGAMTTPTPSDAGVGASIIIQNVPFILQAPLNEWKDPDFQNACEEASVLMAYDWATGKTAAPSRPEARQQILDITNWEYANMGNNEDLNAQDTAKLMRDYFNYPNVTVQNNITADDIIAELQKGDIIIVPVNGRALNNIHFTQPGPLEHTELIKGYDFTKNEFIVNDTGIGVGNSYRYPKDLLFNAIREYPTGNHLPIMGDTKVMMVISK